MSITGSSFTTKNLENDSEHKIKFQIWDTAGKERFRSLPKIFYQNASVAVLVYNITRKESFDKLKDFWIEELKENAPSDIILDIAGNKIDKYELEVVSHKRRKRISRKCKCYF